MVNLKPQSPSKEIFSSVLSKYEEGFVTKKKKKKILLLRNPLKTNDIL